MRLGNSRLLVTASALLLASLAFSADMSLPAFHRLAVADVVDGAKLWRLAWMLGASIVDAAIPRDQPS